MRTIQVVAALNKATGAELTDQEYLSWYVHGCAKTEAAVAKLLDPFVFMRARSEYVMRECILIALGFESELDAKDQSVKTAKLLLSQGLALTEHLDKASY